MTNIQKTITVLKLLEFGMELTIDGFQLILGEDDKGHDVIGLKMKKFVDDNPPEDVLVNFDVSLNGFIEMMNKVSEEDITLWNAKKVLTEINQKNRKS